jgi:hypothetical protein
MLILFSAHLQCHYCQRQIFRTALQSKHIDVTAQCGLIGRCTGLRERFPIWESTIGMTATAYLACPGALFHCVFSSTASAANTEAAPRYTRLLILDWRRLHLPLTRSLWQGRAIIGVFVHVLQLAHLLLFPFFSISIIFHSQVHNSSFQLSFLDSSLNTAALALVLTFV